MYFEIHMKLIFSTKYIRVHKRTFERKRTRNMIISLPSYPRSAYSFFCSRSDGERGEHGGNARAWKNMINKDKYIILAKNDKERYSHELAVMFETRLLSLC